MYETNDEHCNTWLPMCTRIDFAPLEESFIGHKFPYEAPVLALAIKELLVKDEVTLTNTMLSEQQELV